MKLLLVAYPKLSADDLLRIENYRKDYDKQFEIIRPHFTFIFPVTDIAIEEFTLEVKKHLHKINPIQFCLRHSILIKDYFSDYYYTFLVPDEGFIEMIKLHDKLYSERLFAHQMHDIDFIPHITAASFKDHQACKKSVDEWNSKSLTIKGTIDSFDIVSYENEKVTNLEKFFLIE